MRIEDWPDCFIRLHFNGLKSGTKSIFGQYPCSLSPLVGLCGIPTPLILWPFSFFFIDIGIYLFRVNVVTALASSLATLVAKVTSRQSIGSKTIIFATLS